jgi:glutathione S-transferase
MKLFWTQASPFTRKVCVSARELRLWPRIEVIPTTWPLNWGYETVDFTPGLAQANPLARIPTLITEHGDALGDSTLACIYLDELAGGGKLIPSGAARWRMWSLYAVADGILEAQVAMRAEGLRPAAERCERFLAKQRERIERCFDAIEARTGELDGAVDLAQITLGVACGYQHWREWLRDFAPARPRLVAWYARFSQREAMLATTPRETPHG